MITDEERNKGYEQIAKARKVLKKGDRIRVSRCGGIVATYTFDHWDDDRIVSKSGIDDLFAGSISKINGVEASF